MFYCLFSGTVYFNLSQAFNKVHHTLLLDKLNNFGLSSVYVKWFQSYLTNRSSFVCILGKFSSTFSLLSGVPQGSILGLLLFNIFIYGLSAKINHSKFILFAYDLKTYRGIKSFENCLELKIQKTKIISLTCKTSSIHFNYCQRCLNFAFWL
jgi:hypothetical protein